MSGSTLSLQYDDFRKAIGRYLGFSRGGVEGADWSADQKETINAILESGERQFYTPPMLPGEHTTHQWSFLRPTGTSILSQSASILSQLPLNFGGFIGAPVYSSSSVRGELRVIGEQQILQMKSTNDTTGVPRYCAIVPLSSVPQNTSQFFGLDVWPTPDSEYTIEYQYHAITNKIVNGDDRHTPLGSAVHAETILASCLAIAEQRENDEQGTQWNYFMQRLVASIHIDRALMTPQTIGYMGSGTGSVASSEEYRQLYGGVDVTVGGVQY